MNSTSMHRLLAPIAAAVLSSVLSSAAWGDTQWKGGNGDWNTITNWTDGVPDVADVATLDTYGTVTVDGAAQAKQLFVDSGQTVQQSANVLAVTDVTFVGWSGTGSFYQSGGEHTVGLDLNLGQLPGSSGTYDLSGTGQVTLGRNLHIGLEGTGVFTQSGTTQVNVTGGVLLPGNVTNPGSGTYKLQSGSVTSGYMTVGVAGAGNIVNHTGGTNTTGALTVGGDGGGAYSLGTGGILSVTGNAIVGQFDMGAFTQTGGTSSATALAVGYGNEGDGSFNLSDGTVNTDRTYVGLLANSTGTYNQTGGTHTVGTGTAHALSGTLTIARDIGSKGTYDLSGGVLQADAISLGKGTAELIVRGSGVANVGAGTNTKAGTLRIGPDGSLTGTGTVTATTVLNDGGIIAPGSSPGEIKIIGDFLFSSGVLEIEVAGLDAGDFDVLNIDGNADLTGGTILFSFIDEFLPSQGDVIDFLIAKTVAIGNSVRFAYEGAAPGFEFIVTAGDNGLIFTALNDAVPEPATLVLFAAGLAGLGAARRKKLAA